MEKNELVVKSSFKGIKGQLFKHGICIIILITIFTVFNFLLQDVYSNYKMTSILDLMTNIFQVKMVHAFEIVILNIILLILIIFTIHQIIKIISLLIIKNNKLVFDIISRKVVNYSYSSIYKKIVDENIFENILEVQIEQDYFDSAFETGNIYIEYTRKDSKEGIVGNLSIDNIYKPFDEKDKLMNKENF